MRVPFLFLLSFALLGDLGAAVTPEYQTAKQARINGTYIMVVMADGTKAMVPLASLKIEDRDWLVELSKRQPLAEAKSKVVVVAASELSAAKAKQTIVTATTQGPLETVQLCAPNVLRDQIGGTCMLYARVHWLDIAGYYSRNDEIYKIINDTPPDAPWQEPRYVRGLTSIFTSRQPNPVRHRLPPEADPFDWARSELRKGRPLLAAFPREIWQALPPGFIAAHPWNEQAIATIPGPGSHTHCAVQPHQGQSSGVGEITRPPRCCSPRPFAANARSRAGCWYPPRRPWPSR